MNRKIPIRIGQSVKYQSTNPISSLSVSLKRVSMLVIFRCLKSYSVSKKSDTVEGTLGIHAPPDKKCVRAEIAWGTLDIPSFAINLG